MKNVKVVLLPALNLKNKNEKLHSVDSKSRIPYWLIPIYFWLPHLFYLVVSAYHTMDLMD